MPQLCTLLDKLLTYCSTCSNLTLLGISIDNDILQTATKITLTVVFLTHTSVQLQVRKT